MLLETQWCWWGQTRLDSSFETNHRWLSGLMLPLLDTRNSKFGSVQEVEKRVLLNWLCTGISVQFSHSVKSDSLQPHGLQHTRPPCLSPTPRVYPNPCPSSWWCHPTILSSVGPLSSCPQSFPASGSFQMSQLFAWGIGASASVIPMTIQDWFPLGCTGRIILNTREDFPKPGVQ